jgi:Pvc16 N-terminal domain
MIDAAFALLNNQLAAYIESMGGDRLDVIMANIAAIDAANSNVDLERKVILSLVNIEEEAALKNAGPLYRNVKTLNYVNPPIYLNLYLLITAHYEKYEDALTRLSNVIQFFQGKNSFSLKNSPPNDMLLNPDTYEDIQLHLEMFSLSFEQLNHLWGSLGGKQWPSVLYKVRLVKITENRITAQGPLIEEVQTKDNIITAEQ